MPQHRFPQGDGRAIARLKWSADKSSGPLVHFAELVLKRLLRLGFPASYERIGLRYDKDMQPLDTSQVRFVNALGSTPAFEQTLSDVLYIVARNCRVEFVHNDGVVMLANPYVLRLRYGKEGTKPVAVSFHPAVELVHASPPF